MNMECARYPPQIVLLAASLSGLERVAALGVLLALAPLLLMVAIATALLSRTSPLIAHRRLGLGGSSVLGAEVPHHVAARRAPGGTLRSGRIHRGRERPAQEDAATAAFPAASRVFAAGIPLTNCPSFCTSCAVKCRWSGRGPSPPPSGTMHYRPHAAEVLEVKPGLSGLWQIMGRSRLTYAAAPRSGPGTGAQLAP